MSADIPINITQSIRHVSDSQEIWFEVPQWASFN
jgi:hypothetical protein